MRRGGWRPLAVEPERADSSGRHGGVGGNARKEVLVGGVTITMNDAGNSLRARLDEEIYAFNVEATGIADARLLSISAQDDRGELCAGLFGWTWGGCGSVELLWGRGDRSGGGLGSR